MSQNQNSLAEAAEPRRGAEERLNEETTKAGLPNNEANWRRLLHELQARQVELEQQREQLRAAQTDLKAGLEKYTDLYDSAPVGYFRVDREKAICGVNLAGASLLGIERARLTNRPILAFVAAADRPAFNAFLQKVCETRAKDSCEVGLLKEGQRPFFARIEATLSEDGQEYRAMVMDMSERKRAEEQIRHQAALLDLAPDAIVVCDLDGRLQYVNHGAEQLFRWSQGEVLGRRVQELLYRDPAEFEAAQAQLLQDGDWSGELNLLAQGGEDLWAHTRMILVRDPQGQPQSFLCVSTDISEKKKAETQVLRAQRLEAIGLLVGGIAHDLNNALSPVLMGMEMLRLQLTDPESQQMLNLMQGSAERGASMIKQMLSFARGAGSQRSTVQPEALIRDLGVITRQTFPKNIQVRSYIPAVPSPVTGDATQLHQVLLNLAVNARDAMPQGGILTLGAAGFFVDESFALMTPEAKVGPYIVLTVADTGTGIPPCVRARLFEPFFTTKPPGQGTGLGLCTARRIVKNHGGFMTVDSEVGQGTRFRFYLPAAGKTPAPVVVPAPPPLPRGKGEMILVVDDEPAICTISKVTLQTHGYRVLTACDGAAAVALAAQHRDGIGLMLTDMLMPLLDGPATIRAVRQLLPQLRIVVASGDASDHPALCQELGVQAVLRKPFTADTLLQAVHGALGVQIQ